MQNFISILATLFVYCSLSLVQIQAQPWGDQKGIVPIHYKFLEPRHFEVKAELDGGCFKGNQTLFYSEIHRKKVKPEYLQKIILENKRTKRGFTAMVFIVNEKPISMNVLDEAFITHYCLNSTKLPVSIQGDIIHLLEDGALEEIYFVRQVKLLQ